MILRDVRDLLVSKGESTVPGAAEELGQDVSIVQSAFDYWLGNGSLKKVEESSLCGSGCKSCPYSKCGLSVYADVYIWEE